MNQTNVCTAGGLNHHLWNNNGTWWMHYTIYPTSLTKERRRCSLHTKSVEEARMLRDMKLVELQSQGCAEDCRLLELAA